LRPPSLQSAWRANIARAGAKAMAPRAAINKPGSRGFRARGRTRRQGQASPLLRESLFGGFYGCNERWPGLRNFGKCSDSNPPACQKPSVGADSEWNRRLTGKCRPSALCVAKVSHTFQLSERTVHHPAFEAYLRSAIFEEEERIMKTKRCCWRQVLWQGSRSRVRRRLLLPGR
jgi:hypothetical protein